MIELQVEEMKKATQKYNNITAPAAMKKSQQELLPIKERISESKKMMFYQCFVILLFLMNQQQGLIYGDYKPPLLDEESQLNYVNYELATNVISFFIFVFQTFYIMSHNMSTNQYVTIQYILFFNDNSPFLPGILAYINTNYTGKAALAPFFTQNNLTEFYQIIQHIFTQDTDIFNQDYLF